MDMDRSSILIVDDDPEILRFLKTGLAFEGFSVDTAENGAQALEKVRHKEPDVVILDILMPGIDGIEVSKRLRQVSDVPILMLTAKDTVADRVAGLDAGADDYLAKPFAFEELLARIRALLRRRRIKEVEVLNFCDITLNTGSREVKIADKLIELTAQEFDLLELFLRYPNQVLKRKRIYESVWGVDITDESNVIEVYIRYLRTKLEGGDRPKLIHTVRGVGYILKEPVKGAPVCQSSGG